jgi:tetratricopeptide (TPR) repeat protein
MKMLHRFSLFLLLVTGLSFGQKSKIYTNDMVEFNHAMELYENKDYAAAQVVFKEIRNGFDDDSELKARSYYYEAFCAIRLGQSNGEELMNYFFEQFPTSTKRSSAFLEVGDYYFNNQRYAYALKWFSKVKGTNLTQYDKEEFSFKKGYSLFAVGSYADSKRYFSELLDSPKFGSQAKYYYGYMAYQDDNYVEADKYLNQVADQAGYDEEVDYYLVNIRFKTGKFQEVIDTGLPLLEESNGIQRSELSKIIGESYFNLNEFDRAIPYLEGYEGKKGKWNNTDYYLLGYAYYQQENYPEAILWFSKIIDGNNAVSQNAYYHLAECYLKDGRKQEALNAFKNAQEMDFSPEIKKDAWVNYAKLGYEIGNPYQSPASVIEDYLNSYPESEQEEEMRDLLVSAYLNSNDYQGAIDYLERSDRQKDETYQKVAFLYGILIFKEGKYSDASAKFDLSAEIQIDPAYHARAVFWKAESQYRLDNYEVALETYKKFRDLPGSRETDEYDYYLYQIAYAFFQLGDYNQAGGHFDEFIEQGGREELIIDSYLRLGDSYFALSNYYKAVPAYQKVIEANEKDLDYAQLQIAFCQGFMGQNDDKVSSLLEFTRVNLKSPLRDDAFYELGNTYVKMDQTDKALDAYDKVISNYRMSSLVPKALLKQGLVYFNRDQGEDALTKYKEVITRYPGTEESKEAVSNAKQIYMDLGKVDEYERFVNSVDFISVSDDEIETTMYTSAEQFYLTGNYDKAIESFDKYLQRFPTGANALTATFYLADAYHRTGQTEESIPYYERISEMGNNEYTEQSLIRVSQHYLEDDQWEKSIDLLKRLEEGAGSYEGQVYAQSNLMKGYYGLKNYEKAVEYAEKVLSQDKIETRVESDAHIIIARAAFETGDMLKAEEEFARVGESATGELKAETVYYDAYFKHEEGNYKLSNVSVQELASKYPEFSYWGGKGLIVMAKNFYQLEDAYQATYILESVIQKFSDYPDITEAAKLELNRIKREESKTNSSVIIENK